MPAQKPREIAAQLLVQRRNGDFVELLLDRALERYPLPPEDRRFLQELVYGAVRWELTLDWLISQKSAPQKQKPLVQNLLRVALYQMFWLDRVPSYAVVNETVEICKREGMPTHAKFINALLRGYEREKESTTAQLTRFKIDNLSLGYSHPAWLCHQWEARWGKEDILRLLEWNNRPPATFARINFLKSTPVALLDLWVAEGVVFEEAPFAWAEPNSLFKLLKHPPLATLPTFERGLFYIQDPSTLLAVQVLDPQPGETILDLCAAPGGKTTYIAQKMQNQGQILAEDLDLRRLKRLVENSSRLGVTCVSVDPGALPGNRVFDRILVDAPCSNSGVMRRRVELRWRISPEEIQRLREVQISLLASAAKRVRPGGVIVYSTCSLEPTENGEVVREFLSLHPGFALQSEQTLTPFGNGTDGAYVAKLSCQPNT